MSWLSFTYNMTRIELEFPHVNDIMENHLIYQARNFDESQPKQNKYYFILKNI